MSQIQKAAASLNCIVHFGTRHRHRLNWLQSLLGFHALLSSITFKITILRSILWSLLFILALKSFSVLPEATKCGWIFKIVLRGEPSNPPPGSASLRDVAWTSLHSILLITTSILETPLSIHSGYAPEIGWRIDGENGENHSPRVM